MMQRLPSSDRSLTLPALVILGILTLVSCSSAQDAGDQVIGSLGPSDASTVPSSDSGVARSPSVRGPVRTRCPDDAADWLSAGVPSGADEGLQWADLRSVDLEISSRSMRADFYLAAEPDFEAVSPKHELALGLDFADRSALVLSPDPAHVWVAKWSRGGAASQEATVAVDGPLVRVTVDDPSPPYGVAWSAFIDYRSTKPGHVGALVSDECAIP